jgi:tetratricopeptide (TPR) repeat protein
VDRHARISRDEQSAAEGAAGQNDAHRYWAFLSYSHGDTAMADKLHRQLETYRVPRNLVGRPHPLGTIPQRLTPIFRDRHELAASSDLSREIDEALNGSRYLIVLCSPASARSRWVDQEVCAFKRRYGEERVLAAIIAGEPFAANEAEECFPPSLRFHIDRRGKVTTKPAEPIAADLRDSGDGWRSGTLKLIAGMLDVGLDDLVQRDQLRRQKRMTAIVMASLLGMAFTSGMAFFAIDARDAARDQRREAESLVGFMLGDLRAELEPIGRLDALDKVGARALAYYEGQDKTELGDDQLAQRSRALTLLGEIAMDRLDLRAAEARYKEAMSSTAELVQRDPTNPDRLFDHAQNVFYVGDLARKRGDLLLAEQSFISYRELADRMVALAPSDPKYQLERKYALNNLGVVLYERHRFAEASRVLEAALANIDGMVRREPGNLDYLKSKLETTAWLADSKNSEWRPQEALSIRLQGLTLLERMIAQRPRDVGFQERLVPWLRSVARLQASGGDVGAGIVTLRRGLATADRLVAAEPGNKVWSQDAANLRIDLTAMLIDRGRVGEAASEIAGSCDNRAIIGSDAAALEERRIAVSCLHQRARLALAQGQSAQALILAGEALASARRFRSGNNTNDRLQVAEAQLLVGDVIGATGERAGARMAYRAGLEIWPEDKEESPRSAALRAALLSGSGQRALAAPVNRRLAAINYRKIF